MHESTELPDFVTLLGDVLQEVLLVERFTTPEKPFSADTEIVEVRGEPDRTVSEVGLALREKSAPELKITNTLLERPQQFPVIVTLKTPLDDEVQERETVPLVAVLLSVMEFLLREQDMPPGWTLVIRSTFPEKPLSP